MAPPMLPPKRAASLEDETVSPAIDAIDFSKERMVKFSIDSMGVKMISKGLMFNDIYICIYVYIYMYILYLFIYIHKYIYIFIYYNYTYLYIYTQVWLNYGNSLT